MSYLATLPQYLLPQHLITRLVGKLINCQQRWLKERIIQWFIWQYKVDMSEAIDTNPQNYTNFNDFFTRKLQANTRPIVTNEEAIACPNDGYVSQLGTIEDNRIFQAKGHDFTLLELFGHDATTANQFQHGKFATLYLSPKDYHRVHMPYTGTLQKTIYIPGRLFAVKPTTVNTVKNLFARNERVVCLFNTALGPMAVILVGAIIVGSIHTVWSGQVSPTSLKQVTTTDYSTQDIRLNKGDELGHFQLGSTAIILFPKDTIQWHESLSTGSTIKLGQQIAVRT